MDIITTKVFRKDTHTQRYLNWDSNHPNNCKLGVIKGLIHRAHILCDKNEDLLNEITLLKDIFISNGYPARNVEKIIKESWKEELRKSLLDEQSAERNKNKSSEFYYILQAPYVKGFSENLQKELRKVNIGYVPKKSATIRSMICQLKPEVCAEQRKDVVYSIGCKTCKKSYIGETGKTFNERRKRHQQEIRSGRESNAFFKHLEEHTEHEIDWKSFVLIDKESHWKKRKIKEALYINAMNPTEKIENILNLEKGLEIDKTWNALIEEVKSSIPHRRKDSAYETEDDEDIARAGNHHYR
jgi:GIY-YIG catalytic domain